MSIVKRTCQLLGALSLVGFAASQVSAAGECRNSPDRPFPATSDSMTLSCKSAAGATTSGVATAQTVAGQRQVVANLTAGSKIFSRGVTSTGSVKCTATDLVVGGGAVTTNCSAEATHWHGIVQFNN